MYRLIKQLCVAALCCGMLVVVDGCSKNTYQCIKGELKITTLTIHRIQNIDQAGWVMAVATDGGELMIPPKVAAECRKRGELAAGRRIVFASTSRGPCPPIEEVLRCR